MSKRTIKLTVFIICCALISMGRLLLCKGQVFAQDIEPEGSYVLYAEDGLDSMCPSQARLEGSYVLYAEDGIKTWQGNIAGAMKALNNNLSGIWYSANGIPYLDSDYWTGTFQSGWTPNANKEPSAAIEWYFSNLRGTGYSTECRMAAAACVYKGLLDTVGKTAFNEWFRNHRSDLCLAGTTPSPLLVIKRISSENDLIKGDWVYFQNFVDASSCPYVGALQGENAIVQTSNGIRTYIGLGLPPRGGEPMTSIDMCEYLGLEYLNIVFGNENIDYEEAERCLPTRDVMLARAAVLTASPAYFANFNRSSPPTTSTKPLAPGNLRATAVSSSRINITWTDNSNNETGFKIYRANFTTQKWDLIHTVSANSTSCYDDNLSSGTTYYYTVGAYNEAGTNAPTGSDGKILSVSATTY